MGIIRTARLRLRCSLRTNGAHELDISSGRCKHCKRRWTSLYRSTKRPVNAEAKSPVEAAPIASSHLRTRNRLSSALLAFLSRFAALTALGRRT